MSPHNLWPCDPSSCMLHRYDGSCKRERSTDLGSMTHKSFQWFPGVLPFSLDHPVVEGCCGHPARGEHWGDIMAVAGVQAWHILWHCLMTEPAALAGTGPVCQDYFIPLDCLIYGGMLTKDFVIVTPTRAIMTLSLSDNEAPIGEEVTRLSIWCEDCHVS